LAYFQGKNWIDKREELEETIWLTEELAHDAILEFRPHQDHLILSQVKGTERFWANTLP
jgi:hypothetical protein